MIDFKILILDDNPVSIYGILGDFCDKYLNMDFSLENKLEINIDHPMHEVLGREVSISFVLNYKSESEVDKIDVDEIINVIESNRFNQNFDLVLIDDHWGAGEEYAGQDKILPEVLKKIKGSYPGFPWIALFTKHFYDSDRLKRFYENLKEKGINSEKILPPQHKDVDVLFSLLFWAIKAKIYYLEALESQESAKEYIECIKKLIGEKQLKYNPQDCGLIGNSEYMKALFADIQIWAEYDINLLLTGETGTGKTKIAKVIHKLSRRKDKPFVSINCANLLGNILESELFGHEKGAFTGAHATKKGLFEVANRGTIFLDEITEMSPDLQAKLLTAIESKRFRRLGSNKDIEVDVRIIAATNKDIQELVEIGKFRRDLRNRFKHCINIRPLREHKEDILPLVNFFKTKFQKEYKKNIEISEDAMKFLMNYDFPGNIRELESIIESIFIYLEDGSEVTKEKIESILKFSRLDGKNLSDENETEKSVSLEIRINDSQEYIQVQDILDRLEEACQKALEQKFPEGKKDYCLTREEWAKYCRRERGGKQGVTTQYINKIFKEYAPQILELLEKHPDRWPFLNKLKILDKRSKTVMDLKEFCKKKLAS